MENVKKLILIMILLIVLTLCGTAVMKLSDLILELGYDNIWVVGFKVGFLAWLLLIIGNLIYKRRKSIC